MPLLLIILAGGGALIAWRALSSHRGHKAAPGEHAKLPTEEQLLLDAQNRQQHLDYEEKIGEVNARTYAPEPVEHFAPGVGLVEAPDPPPPADPALADAPPPPPPPAPPTAAVLTAQLRAQVGNVPAPYVPEPPARATPLEPADPPPMPAVIPGTVPPPPRQAPRMKTEN